MTIFPCLAQISIEGVSDERFYGDSVTFKVRSEAGYSYSVELNGSEIDTDVDIVVDEPDYYELLVRRIEDSSQIEESELIQFIVRAGDRGNSESGLPKWTPYPEIASASAEFSSASLNIVTPSVYPSGLEIPVIVRVEDTEGRRIGVNGFVTAADFVDYPLKLFRGTGSVFLPGASRAGVISYDVKIKTLQVEKQIVIEEDTVWQSISQDITVSTNWGPGARIHISGVAENRLTIARGAVLSISSRSVVVIDPDIEIAVEGSIVVNGNQSEPVVFTTFDRGNPWGGFLFRSNMSKGDFTGSIFTASGADSRWFSNNSGSGSSHRKDQCLFYLSDGARVNLVDCYMTENAGQIAHGEDSYLTMRGCLAQKCTTIGQFNGGAIDFEDCDLIEFPSAGLPYADGDNDGLYLTSGDHSLTGCLIGWALDDGIDAGGSSGDIIIVDNCWFESCYHEGIAWSGAKIAEVSDSVFLNCGQGVECGYDDPKVTMDHCLSTSNLVGARFGDNYDWNYDDNFLTVTNSLLLFNYRDVWGRAWDNWQLHLLQMDIHGNYFSVPNANYPDNVIWDPQNEPSHEDSLASFISVSAEKVGIGFATLEDVLEYSEISKSIPVRLSTFTTNTVQVDYTVASNVEVCQNGTLLFMPGDTIEFIELQDPPSEDFKWIKISLHDPVNAELTGFSQLTYTVPYDPEISLIDEGDLWRYCKGVKEPPSDWKDISFDDALDPGWLSGATGIGFESDSGYESKITTDLDDMEDGYISVYARKEFFIENPAQVDTLTLYMHYDDGYIAYINGQIVDSRNPPEPAVYDEPASGSHEACKTVGCQPDRIDLTGHIDKLVQGANVLALQVHNRTIGSSDFLFVPSLKYEKSPIAGDFEPDGDIDLEDFAVLSSAWSTQFGQENYNPICDISTPPDSIINILDLAIFAENWSAGL